MAITGKNTFKITAVGNVLTGTYLISRIQWISETSTDGDNLLLSDGRDDIVWEAVADATTYEDIVYLEQWVTDLTVTTMDSGYIVVTTK